MSDDLQLKTPQSLSDLNNPQGALIIYSKIWAWIQAVLIDPNDQIQVEIVMNSINVINYKKLKELFNKGIKAGEARPEIIPHLLVSLGLPDDTYRGENPHKYGLSQEEINKLIERVKDNHLRIFIQLMHYLEQGDTA